MAQTRSVLKSAWHQYVKGDDSFYVGESMKIPQIPLVIDTKTTQTVSAEVIQAVYEVHELIHIRHNNKKEHRFVCYHCRQLVHLHAMPDKEREHRYHFQHPPGIECEWKSNYVSKQEIYKGVKEGERHINLKNLVAETLHQLNDWCVVNVDSKFVYSPDKHERRKPDVHAQYKGQDIAIEIQLRTESHHTIQARHQFYREKGWPLLWLSMPNEEMVSEGCQDSCLPILHVQKDIAFTNQGSWFVFDEYLSSQSIKKGSLQLLVKQYEPVCLGKQIEYEWCDYLLGFEELIKCPGQCYYHDFYEQQAACEARLREEGHQSAKLLLDKHKYHHFENFLRDAKSAWPTFNKEQDLTYLNELYKHNFQGRESSLKEKIIYFFKSDEWQVHGDKSWWMKTAKAVDDLNFGIIAKANLAVIEKLLLILGHSLSRDLSPKFGSHIQSCYDFFKISSHRPYIELCKRAIHVSPLRDSLLNDEYLKNQLRRDISYTYKRHDLDRFFSWFISGS